MEVKMSIVQILEIGFWSWNVRGKFWKNLMEARNFR